MKQYSYLKLILFSIVICGVAFFFIDLFRKETYQMDEIEQHDFITTDTFTQIYYGTWEITEFIEQVGNNEEPDKYLGTQIIFANDGSVIYEGGAVPIREDTWDILCHKYDLRKTWGYENYYLPFVYFWFTDEEQQKKNTFIAFAVKSHEELIMVRQGGFIEQGG